MKLANKLHISEAEILAGELASMLDSSQSVSLDISEVEQVDTASIQIFCSLQKSLALTDNKISWVGESKAFSDAADMLGVAEYLNLTSV